MRGGLQNKRGARGKRRGEQRKGNERRESERRVSGSREIWEGKKQGKAEAWRWGDCSYCRGGPTATYMLHSYKCAVSASKSTSASVSTSKVCPMLGFTHLHGS